MRPELEVRWWPRRPRRRWRRKEVTVGRGRKRAPSGAWEKMNPPAPDNSIQHDRITFTPPPPPPCINPRQVMKSLHFLIVVAFPPPLPPSTSLSLLFPSFKWSTWRVPFRVRGGNCCYIPVPLSLWRNISFWLRYYIFFFMCVCAFFFFCFAAVFFHPP